MANQRYTSLDTSDSSEQDEKSRMLDEGFEKTTRTTRRRWPSWLSIFVATLVAMAVGVAIGSLLGSLSLDRLAFRLVSMPCRLRKETLCRA